MVNKRKRTGRPAASSYAIENLFDQRSNDELIVNLIRDSRLTLKRINIPLVPLLHTALINIYMQKDISLGVRKTKN